MCEDLHERDKVHEKDKVHERDKAEQRRFLGRRLFLLTGDDDTPEPLRSRLMKETFHELESYILDHLGEDLRKSEELL